LLEVIWTDEARANLTAVRAYIGQFSPLNSQRFSVKLVNAVETLTENPNRGRPVGAIRIPTKFGSETQYRYILPPSPRRAVSG
jgi:plasmid stabilization system protein ParE